MTDRLDQMYIEAGPRIYVKVGALEYELFLTVHETSADKTPEEIAKIIAADFSKRYA